MLKGKATLTFCEKYNARGNVTLPTKADCPFEVINLILQQTKSLIVLLLFRHF